MKTVYNMPELSIKYVHGNKYTRHWIVFCKHKLGGFSLSYLYNGGRFSSEKEVLKGIENIKAEGWPIKSVEKIMDYNQLRS